MITEKWTAIEGFKSYEVSNLGRVRRSIPCAGSRVGRVLKQQFYGRNKAYLYVGLSKDAKVYFKRVHILVAKAFIPNPKGLPEVNHLGPKNDCRATMLEWRSKLGHSQDRTRRNQGGDGVSFNIAKDQYKAGYGLNGKWNFLGWFNTYEAASQARKAAVKKIPHTV